MQKYVNFIIFILASLPITMLYINIPVYCSKSGECNWFHYIIPFLALSNILMIITRVRKLNLLNVSIIIFHAALLFSAVLSYSLIGDEFSFLAVNDYLNALIMVLMVSVYFRFLDLNNNNAFIIMFISTILAIFFNIIDMFAPGSYFKVIDGFGVRAAGYYVNANNSALGILVGMTLTINSLRYSIRVWYALIALFAVVLTFSRGGLFLWLIIYVLLLIRNEIPRVSGVLVLPFLIFLSAVFSLLVDYLSRYNDELYLIANRLDFFSGSASKEDVSSDARYSLIEYSWGIFNDSPFIGNGSNSLLRSGSDQLSHNQYLTFLTDYGLIGFFCYIFFIVFLYIKVKVYKEFFLLVLIAGFFTHNIFNSYTFIIAFAYVANNFNKSYLSFKQYHL